jgi:RNA polymerase sigma-70 factor (ECF subfamily)
MIKLIKLIESKLNFSEVYNQTYKKIFNSVCMRYAKKDYDLAQEYCQNGFIRVYKNLDKYSGTGNLEGWVNRVVTNEIINQLRSAKTKPQSDGGVDVNTLNIVDEPVEKEDEIEYMGKYSKQLIKRAIDSLPEGYKFVFIRYFFNDKSHKEIANELGIDEGTSRSQLAKAKAKIKQYLESHK